MSCYGDGWLGSTVCLVKGMGGLGVQFVLLWECVVGEYSLSCYGDGWLGSADCPVMEMVC